MIVTTMSSHDHHCLLRLLTAVLSSLLLLLFPVSCFVQHQQHPVNSPPQGMFMGVKTRIGSTPPSCHNKCNGCHPCMAVQVPTLPSHNKFQPGFITKKDLLDPYPTGNRYSNYKPLGWKCRCRDHFYNP